MAVCGVDTFIIEPVGNLLIDVIHYTNTDCQQDLGSKLEEEDQLSLLDLTVHPVLELKDAPHCNKYHNETEEDDRNCHQVAEDGAFPVCIEWF